MSILLYLVKSFLIGLAIAMPVGPIGMLCIRKTIEIGIYGTIAVGLGAALADSFYGMIAGLGLASISGFLLSNSLHIKLLGGIFLLYLAYKELSASTSTETRNTSRKGFAKLVALVFFLTITNPLTIMSFIGIFASIGGTGINAMEAVWMVIGVFLGSMTWWLILGAIVIKAKKALSAKHLRYIRYISALILAGFGVAAIVSAGF